MTRTNLRVHMEPNSYCITRQKDYIRNTFNKITVQKNRRIIYSNSAFLLAAWLSGNVIVYWSRLRDINLALLLDFLSRKIILRYVRTGYFCMSVPFLHVLYCVFFGGGPCILLPTVQRKPFNCVRDTTVLTNSMAYGTRRFNAAFTRAIQ